MDRVILSDSRDPFFNLALENRLFARAGEESLLYLWRNSPVVVIGRFQNPWRECNLDKMVRDGVHMARRETGGGAVYHDNGNLCFSFIGSYDETIRTKYRAANISFICDALASLGIHAVSEGRNDILVNGMKVSGSAFREVNGRFIHHGTLLINADLGRLAEYLNPSEQKLKSKGIKSVRARVTNLSSIHPEVTVKKVVDVLIHSSGCENITHIGADALKEDHELAAERDRLTGRDWNFGHSPDFTHSIMLRTQKGEMEIAVKVCASKIENIEVFGDALDIEYVPSLKPALAEFLGKAYDQVSLSDIEHIVVNQTIILTGCV